MIPCMKATGRKMATMAVEVAIAAKMTSREPFKAASTIFSPFSWWRTMFSKTMMASSTTTPMERDKARRVKVFRVKPKKYMTMKVPKSEVGMAKKTLKVEDQ